MTSLGLHYYPIKILQIYLRRAGNYRFPKVDEKEICQVNISKSGKPVFIKFEGNEQFYVRNGNASMPKSRQEQSEYEKLHWNI